MKPEYKKIIKELNKLAGHFPDDLMLFSANGDLLVVNIETKEVIASIGNIHNDGGDPSTMCVGDKEFLLLD